MRHREIVTTKRKYTTSLNHQIHHHNQVARSCRFKLSNIKEIESRLEIEVSSLPSLKRTYHNSSLTSSPISTLPSTRPSSLLSNTEQLVNPSIISNSRTTRYLTKGTSSKMNRHIYVPTTLFVALIALTAYLQVAVGDRELDMNMRKLNISQIVNVPSGAYTIHIDMKGNAVKPGAQIPVKNFRDVDVSKIKFGGDESSMYTIMLLDLDRKIPPSNKSSIYNQYSNFNIPGNDVTRGQSIVPLEAPVVPCHASSKHRILMLALTQRQAIEVRDLLDVIPRTDDPSARQNFNLESFMRSKQLSIYAANVFQAIGETGGMCSGTISLRPSNIFLIAMVIGAAALFFKRVDRS